MSPKTRSGKSQDDSNAVALATELVTEHLGFLPLAFVDDVINSVNELIYQATSSLERFVESELGANEHVEQGINQIETLLESAVDKNFDIFELYVLKNIFTIPPGVNVELPHYKNVDYTLSMEEDEKLDEELEQLRKQLVAEKCFNHKLKKAVTNTSKKLSYYEDRKSQLDFIYTSAKNANIASLKDAVSLVADQVGELENQLFKVRRQANQEAFSKLATNTDTRTTYLNGVVAAYIAKQKSKEQGEDDAMDVDTEDKYTTEIASLSDWKDFTNTIRKQ
ncbi:Mis12-domain-containing protein [Basidiobolus meristosporus CBS 931.73]|uniref:Mis12-domain-containing protein n=1 Tax=Basidiobolus meristosporus CBS 931.73 TaxID=1314790 RepID=A0A1Y1YTD6_9FUNG|nr:Mis12-domain-containing protein [Basidiobolus meristosporus CBS 931.73]|eukprot:ORY01219.1 Mis12-domain-containing protein [Basidiobolus meristosporus CBS 931.73]